MSTDVRPGARRSWARRLVYMVAGLVGLLAVSFGLLEYTQRPKFCTTCHYMDPYYKSWQQSSHNKVNCLQCHYPPGIRSVVRAKIVALSQVVQYVTRTYGSRPWAEVEDASCLRSGCHETRLLAGTVPFGPDGTIRFDHSHHLKDLKRGKKLRCTSCHAQIVQGQHLTVNPTACFLCHFKNIEWGQDLSRCQTCHDVTKIPPTRFDHAAIVRNKVDCRRCHGDITRGTGEVPKQHCYTCHNDEARLAKYDDTTFIHTKHVTEHKVECSQCHIEITHKIRKITIADDLRCADCHSDTHRDQVRLFLGVTRDNPRRAKSPSPMYEVNVHCVGCHMYKRTLERGGTVRTTTGESCDTCHQPGYDRVLEGWRGLLGRALADTRGVIAAATSSVAALGSAAPRASRTELATARDRLDEVVKGHGVHNIAFALSLLDEAQQDAQRAAKDAGKTVAVPGVPEAKLMRENECRLCHLQPPRGDFSVGGRRFPHGAHVDAVGDCTSCHTPRSKHGKTTVTADDCGGCHGGIEMPHPADWRGRAAALLKASGFAACAACHKGSDATERCQPCHAAPPADRTVMGAAFSHSKHLAHQEVRCASCHGGLDRHGTVKVDQQACTACHGGIAMPHPKDWTDQHPKWAGEHGVDACEKCHEGGMSGKFCATCHG